MALISAVYKWRLDNATYVYITNENGGSPFIKTEGTCEEEKIKDIVITWDEQEYCERFNEMVSFVHAYENGKFSSLQFLDCSVYLKDYSSCDLRPGVPTDIIINTSANTVDYYISSSVVVSDEDCLVQDGEKIKVFDMVFNIPRGIPGLTIKGTVTPSAVGFSFPLNADINDGYIVSRDSVDAEKPIGAKRGDLWICTENTGNKPVFEFNGVNLLGPKGNDTVTYRYDATKNSYMFGEEDVASGENSVTFGNLTTASGVNSLAEGYKTKATSEESHAEGNETTSSGRWSHAEGALSVAEGERSHAEGFKTIARGRQSHAEGSETLASENQTHAEGYGTQALGRGSHTEGDSTIAYGRYSHVEGGNSVTGYEGMSAQTENMLIMPVNENDDNGGYAHAEGAASLSTGKASHSEGIKTYANGVGAHAEGYKSIAGNIAGVTDSYNKISDNSADNPGEYSHAEGKCTVAAGSGSHSEGKKTYSNGTGAHAEGYNTLATGTGAHAEGDSTQATSGRAHAEGENTKAQGRASHAEGCGNVAKNKGQHVSGTYAEIDNTGNAIFQVGIGTDENTRKDAFRINKDGTFVFSVPENMEAPIFTFQPSIEQQEASVINEGEENTAQTYNMRRSAARQVEIPVTTSNFLDLINLQNKIDEAIEGIEFSVNQEDLDELRDQLAEDFEEIVDEQENKYNESIADILIQTSDLQSQIDGEATAWFLEGEPCDKWGTIDTNKEPSKDWNEDGTEGKESYASHKGDTYTDITEYENGKIGKSWRFCYCERKIGDGENDKTTDWHWHEIGDASIARALYEASRAQSTADGKSTVYISKNEDGNRVPDHYQAGDMWIINDIALQYGGFIKENNIYYSKENGQKGTAISVGEMLTANANSKDYNVEHWSKEIKYTDDSYAIEAKNRADEAYDYAESGHTSALKAIELLNGISSDGRVYPNEFKELELKKQTISAETTELVGKDGKGGEASLWEAEVDSADEYFVAANKALSALTYYTNEENCEKDLGYIKILKEDKDKEHVGYWDNISNYYIKRQILLNDIADAAKKYADETQGIAEQAANRADSAIEAANSAAIGASAALGMLDDVDNDKVVAITEFAALESELEVIERDLSGITKSIELYKGSDFYNNLNSRSAIYNIAGESVTYSGFTSYKEAQINAVNALKFHCGKTVISGGTVFAAGENDKNEFGSIIIRSSKIAGTQTKISGVTVDYENIVAYYGVRQSMLDHIAFISKLYAESLQTELSPENVEKILGQIRIDGVNLVTGSRCDFAMGQWGATSALTIKRNVDNDYTQTTVNEDSKLSFCTRLYNGDDVDMITNKQWAGEHISVSMDIFIPENSIKEIDASVPEKLSFGLVFRYYDEEKKQYIDLFYQYATNLTFDYGKWTRLKLTFPMKNDITDVFTKDGVDYLVSHVFLVVFSSGYNEIFKSGTTFKFRKIQIEFNTTCSSWYPSPEDVDEIYSVAVDAQQNANAAYEEAIKSMDILTDMSSDNKLTPQEKVNIRKEWSEIQEEYEQALTDVQRAWRDHGFTDPQEYNDYENAYDSLDNCLSLVDIDEETTTDISTISGTIFTVKYTGREYFNKAFSTYYAKHVGFMNCLAEQLAYLEVRSIEIGGTNLLNGTETMESWTPASYKESTITKETLNITLSGKPATKIITNNGTDKYKAIYTLLTTDQLDFDREYTLSFDVQPMDYTLSVWAKLAKTKGDSTHAANSIVIPAGTYKRITFTGYPYPDADLQLWFGAEYFQTNTTANTYDAIFKIKNLKLEYGNKATAWSPSPEDTLTYINDVKGYAESLTNTLGDALSNQLDGVVSNYFEDGVPSVNYGITKTWSSSDYNLHVGDIYTNSLPNVCSLSGSIGLGSGSVGTGSGSLGTSGSLGVFFTTGHMQIGGSHFGKKYEEQRNESTQTYFLTKCIFDLPKDYRTISISAMAGNYQVMWMLLFYDAEKKYVNNTQWFASDDSSNIPKKGSNYADKYVYYFSIILINKDDSGNYKDICITNLDISGPSVNVTESNQSWRWCIGGDEISSDFHWHRIVDADTLKALQDAANAQDTADGKRRVFTNQPYGPYDVGDLWVKTDANNSALTDTLYCTTSASTGFNATHWKSSTVALNALEGLDNLDISTRNLAIFSTASGVNVTKINPYTFKQISADTGTNATVCNFKIHTYNNNTLQETLFNNTGSTTVGTHKFTKTLTKTCNRINIGDNGITRDTIAYFYLPETLKSGDTISITYTVTNATNGSVTFKDVMIVKGNKAVAFQPSPEDIEASIVVGGRNILRNTRSNTFSVATTEFTFKTYTPTVPLKANTEYVFSVDSTTIHSGTTTGFTVCIYDSTIKNSRSTSMVVPISNVRKFVKFKTSSSVTSTDVVLIYNGIAGSTSGKSMTLQKYKLEEGNVPTEWSAAPEDIDYLQDIMNHGSTEVNGGLVMTNVLGLKDTQGNVTGGISGVKEDNVLLWGGGTYYDAENAADTDYLKVNGGKITTLLKSDGTGKIGAFYIDDDTVMVEGDEGDVVLDSNDVPTYSEIFTTTTEKEEAYGSSVGINTGFTFTVNKCVTIRNTAILPDSSDNVKVSTLSMLLNINGGNNFTVCWTASNGSQQTTTITIPGVYNYQLTATTVNTSNTTVNTFTCTGKTVSLSSSDYNMRIDVSGNLLNTSLSYGTYYITIKCRIEFGKHPAGATIKGFGSWKSMAEYVYTPHATTFNVTLKKRKQIDRITTYIGNNGIASLLSDNMGYLLFNKSDGFICNFSGYQICINQNGIKFYGLPSSSSGLSKGSLYTSGGTLMVKS